ncbi:UNVERIFIED_CONTAM: hypothetical protein FKN15_015501 [Acipenser sinensis]
MRAVDCANSTVTAGVKRRLESASGEWFALLMNFHETQFSTRRITEHELVKHNR